MERIRRVSVVDSVVEAMLQAIQDGRFTPGHKIPSERVLTQEFGVSRTALREAFQKLEQLGKITIRQGDGTYLNDPASVKLFDDISLAFELGEAGMNQYLEARESLELSAVRLAVERATAEDVALLEQILKEQAENLNDPDTFKELDFKFHQALLSAAKNSVLMKLWSSITPLIQEQLVKVHHIPGMLERAFKHHKKIVEAISRDEPTKAQNVIREHLGMVRGDLLTKMSMEISSKE